MESYNNSSADSYLTREDERAEDARFAAMQDMEADGLEIVADDDASTDYDTETDYEEMGRYWDDIQEYPEDYPF